MASPGGVSAPTAARGLGAAVMRGVGKAGAAGPRLAGKVGRIQPPKPPKPVTLKLPSGAGTGSTKPGPGQFHGGPVHAPPGAFTPEATAPPGAGAGGPGSVTGPTLDATALANIAANQFKANEAINSLNQQGTFASTALQNQLAQLKQQQPLSDLRLMSGANARGGLYSSAYGQQLGSLNQGFADRANADQTAYSNKAAEIAAKIAAIQGGIPIYDAGQALGSTDRAGASAATDPGSAAPPTAASAPSRNVTSPGGAKAALARNLAAQAKQRGALQSRLNRDAQRTRAARGRGHRVETLGPQVGTV